MLQRQSSNIPEGILEYNRIVPQNIVPKGTIERNFWRGGLDLRPIQFVSSKSEEDKQLLKGRSNRTSGRGGLRLRAKIDTSLTLPSFL